MLFGVTGGAGFIGSHIVRLLIENDHDVIVIDNMHTGDRKNLADSGRVRLFQTDIRDLDALEDHLCNVDGIFHEAGLTIVPESFEIPDEYLDVNVRGTENVFKVGCSLGVKTVYASSSSVYGNAQTPIKEDDPKNPASPYGQTKVEKDSLAGRYSERGCRIIGLRYFNVFGRGQTGTYAGVITRFAERLRNGSAPIIYGDGMQTRDFVFVRDVARANLQAMMSPTRNGYFNVGTGIPTTILRLATIMIGMSGMDIRPVFEKPSKGDVRHSLADLSSTQRHIGWTADTGLKDGLKTVI